MISQEPMCATPLLSISCWAGGWCQLFLLTDCLCAARYLLFNIAISEYWKHQVRNFD